VAGTLWFGLMTALLTERYAVNIIRSIPVLTLSYALFLFLSCILIFAYPAMRFKTHNSFENTHRFAGWAAVALFWAELILIVVAFANNTQIPFTQVLIREPAFWILIAITLNIIYPWLRLRHVRVVPEKLSDHALRIHFPQKLQPFSGFAIADEPLGEWHPFAIFPDEHGGSSLIVSNAGDWTKKTIMNPQTSYWIRGSPKAGVLSMTCLFKSCVVVATGSGIGPCLAFRAAPWNKTACRMLWSTPSPLKTYGQGVVDLVHEIDREAVIIDTRTAGRPNVVEIAYRLYVKSGAEAVFVISNPKLTRKVIYDMESRGVPAFGPIWDS